jgi:1-deoxy-D-xylulose-5-phosphate reductoisomerase
VEFMDGAVIAQLGVPDMRGPIAYALSYPERMTRLAEALDLTKVGSLQFHRPDPDKFPCLGLSYEAGRQGGTMPAVLNAANEEAVKAFLAGGIRFTDIPLIIEAVMEKHKRKKAVSITDILSADRWARQEAKQIISSY